MNNRFTYCVTLFTFIPPFISCAVLKNGDSCSLQDGSTGKCKFLKECVAARQLIMEGTNPVICGFEGIESIVCCQDEEEMMKTTTTNPVTIRKPGDISKEKCKEYSEYAYEKIFLPTLLLEQTFRKKLVCDFQRNRFVVGISLAARREFPHMALIGTNLRDDNEIHWFCGGSLISENIVLTAAVCASHYPGGPAKLVRLGFTNKSDLAHMQEREVSEVIPHPDFHYPARYHDIALLRLSNDVVFNTFVRPACLQTEKFIPYVSALASGWGRRSYNEEESNDLLATVLEFYTTDTCNKTYFHNSSLGRAKLDVGIQDDFMICAGISKSNRVTCEGDGGGPLQVYHKETEDLKCMYDIIGIVSFGKPCGIVKDLPDVFTRVSAYIQWIEDIVWPI